jgi:hypothetical protein
MGHIGLIFEEYRCLKLGSRMKIDYRKYLYMYVCVYIHVCLHECECIYVCVCMNVSVCVSIQK